LKFVDFDDFFSVLRANAFLHNNDGSFFSPAFSFRRARSAERTLVATATKIDDAAPDEQE